jgi:hypothetical protein
MEQLKVKSLGLVYQAEYDNEEDDGVEIGSLDNFRHDPEKNSFGPDYVEELVWYECQEWADHTVSPGGWGGVGGIEARAGGCVRSFDFAMFGLV